MKKILLLLLIILCSVPVYSAPKKKFSPEKTEKVQKETKKEEKKAEKKEKKKAKKKTPKKKIFKAEKAPEPKLVPVKKKTVKKPVKKAKPAKKVVRKKKAPVRKKKAAVKKKKVVKKKKPVKKAFKTPAVKEKKVVVKPAEKTEPEKKALPPKLFMGAVYDKQTRKPLFGVDIKTDIFPYPAKSTKDGIFKYPMKLRPGKYMLTASKENYKTYEGDLIILEQGDKVFGVIYLSRANEKDTSIIVYPEVPDKEEDIAVAISSDALEKEKKKDAEKKRQKEKKIAEKKKSEPAKKEKKIEKKPEKKKVFNSYDGQKSTSRLPFFLESAPSTAYGTGLLAGGQTSNESAYYFEGVKIPFTNNFLTGTSIINSNLINRYAYTGAYGPELGDSSGSVININLKNPRNDRIGGFFDIGLLGASFLSEGKISENDFFSLSIDYEPEDLFTDVAYDNKNSLASSSNLGGHARYIHNFSKKNSIKMTVLGARNKLTHLSAYKKRGTPNLGETLTPEAMFILAKGDQEYSGNSINSRLTGSFMLSSWEYKSYDRKSFSTIDYRGTVEEHLSWKINCNNRLDFGAVFMAGLFPTESGTSFLPIEGESGMIFSPKDYGYIDNTGYIQPSVYIKYRMKYSGLELVPGINISGDFHNKNEWSGTIDPRLYVSYTLKDMVKFYVSGGLYSRRPEYEMTLFGFGNEALDYEKAVHTKLGINFKWKGFSADVSGFYKYQFNLITRNPDDITNYENIGKGWTAGTEIKLGYKNKELNAWIAYTFLKNERKNSEDLDYRRSDGDIPHNLKAALSYRFHRNWNISADISITSGILISSIEGSQLLTDSGVYLPVVLNDGINERRLSGLIGYGAKLEYFIFFNDLRLGIYAKAKGSKADIDYIYNSDYSDKTKLYLTPFLATVGLTGEF
jgi:outer membrane cobalamin receptor